MLFRRPRFKLPKTSRDFHAAIHRNGCTPLKASSGGIKQLQCKRRWASYSVEARNRCHASSQKPAFNAVTLVLQANGVEQPVVQRFFEVEFQSAAWSNI